MMSLPGKDGRYDLHRIAVFFERLHPSFTYSDLISMCDGTSIIRSRQRSTALTVSPWLVRSLSDPQLTIPAFSKCCDRYRVCAKSSVVTLVRLQIEPTQSTSCIMLRVHSS
jgi:hypothetical protein